MMTEEQLKACENQAPLLVAEVRRIKHETVCMMMADVVQRDLLIRDMLYTLKCGVGTYDAITSYINRASNLGVKIP